MSVSSVVDADYSSVIVACRNALNKGLQAGGAGDISAEVDTADTAIEADLAAAETAAPVAPTYVSNPPLDY